MPQASSVVLVVDAERVRRGALVQVLQARGLTVQVADDAVGALKLLPTLTPDLLVLDTDGLAMDLDTLARGVHSMQALGHLEILVVGEEQPVSTQNQAQVTRLPRTHPPEAVAKEAERLAHRGRKKRSVPAPV